MIPIKLLEDNNRLLAFIREENPELDSTDFLENEVRLGNTDASDLLAIENASEIAKRFIQPIYIDIVKAIRTESKKYDGTRVFRCRNVTGLSKTSVDLEYLHLEKDLEDENGGHAIYLKVDNLKKRINIHDSMGENAYLNEFEEVIRDTYPGYKINDKSIAFQPTGGFIQETPEQFKEMMYIHGEPGYLERAWKVSQFDELSQHHFCYIEAFIAMACDTLPMYRVGCEDPRDRLKFIKKVVWGFIHKFYKGSRKTPEWKYFEETFPNYMNTYNIDNTKMRMMKEMFQIPKKETFKMAVNRFEGIDTSDWSIKQILTWAARG